MTALGMLLAGLGVLLIWCGVKGQDPRSVIASVFNPTKAQGE